MVQASSLPGTLICAPRGQVITITTKGGKTDLKARDIQTLDPFLVNRDLLQLEGRADAGLGRFHRHVLALLYLGQHQKVSRATPREAKRGAGGQLEDF